MKVKKLIDVIHASEIVYFVDQDDDLFARLENTFSKPLTERFRIVHPFDDVIVCYYDLLECKVLSVTGAVLHELIVKVFID